MRARISLLHTEHSASQGCAIRRVRHRPALALGAQAVCLSLSLCNAASHAPLPLKHMADGGSQWRGFPPLHL
jgi:hypothetical protein